MCNNIIPLSIQLEKPWQDPCYKFRHIPKRGIGWKLFRKGEKGLIDNEPYEKEGEWVVWNENRKEAFCFFLTRKQAEACLQKMKEEQENSSHRWRHIHLEEVEVRKIEYRRGLLEREEYQFTPTMSQRLALCKMFRILPEEST